LALLRALEVVVWNFMLVQLSHGLKCQVSLFNWWMETGEEKKKEREKK